MRRPSGGEEIVRQYLAEEQNKIKNFYYKPGMKLKKPVKATIFKEDAHHKAHLHCGSTKINVIEIKE